MRSIVPSASKTKKERELAWIIAASVDEFMEDLKQLPPAERQKFVDLFVQLFVREKNG
jgi:hypothetical protein